jgi:hypothetical protein
MNFEARLGNSTIVADCEFGGLNTIGGGHHLKYNVGHGVMATMA